MPTIRQYHKLREAHFEYSHNYKIKTMPTGIELIAAERKRQIEVEGWTAGHDAEHADMQLAGAAGCYIAKAVSNHLESVNHTNQSPLCHF